MGEHRDLAEREAGVAGRHPAVAQHVEPGRRRAPARSAAVSSALRKTPPLSVDRVQPGALARTVASRGDDEVDDRLVEARRDQAGRDAARTSSRDRATTGAGSAASGPAPSGRGRTGSRADAARRRRASASSSIAAWASYPTRWQTPASEATASKSRPMLDVGTQPSPRSSCRAEQAALAVAAGAHAGQVVGPTARRPRAGATAPSGTGCARRRRRRAAAT